MEGGGSSQDWGGSASSNRYGNLDARSAFQNTQFPAQQPTQMPAQSSGFGGNPSFDPWQAQSPGATFNNWSNNFSQPSATQMPSIPSASSSFQSPMMPQMQQMPGNSEISQPPSPMPTSASVSSYFQPTQTMFPFYQAAMQQQAAPSAPAPAPISAPVAAPPSPAPAQNFTLDQINQVAGVPATPAAPTPMAPPAAPSGSSPQQQMEDMRAEQRAREWINTNLGKDRTNADRWLRAPTAYLTAMGSHLMKSPYEFGSFAGLQNELTAKGVREPQWNGRQWIA